MWSTGRGAKSFDATSNRNGDKTAQKIRRVKGRWSGIGDIGIRGTMTGDTGDMTHGGTIGDIRTTDDMADIRTGTIHMRGTDRRCADTTGMAVDMTGTEGTTGTHRPGIMAGTT